MENCAEFADYADNAEVTRGIMGILGNITMLVRPFKSLLAAAQNRPGVVMGMLAGIAVGAVLAPLVGSLGNAGPPAATLDSMSVATADHCKTIETPAPINIDSPPSRATEPNAATVSRVSEVNLTAHCDDLSPVQTADRIGTEIASPSPAPVRHVSEQAEASSGASVRQAVTLWNASATEFEASLRQALGDRLAPMHHSGSVSEYRVPLAKNELRMCIDGSEGKVVVEGATEAMQGAIQLVRALDNAPIGAENGVSFLPIPQTKPDDLRRLVRAVQSSTRESSARQPAAADLLAQNTRSRRSAAPEARVQAHNQGFALAEDAPADAAQASPNEDTQDRTPAADAAEAEGSSGPNQLVAPVQVEIVEGLDALIIRGRPEDVKRVGDLIRQIEQYSLIMEPSIELAPLSHVEASAIATLLQDLYDQVYAAREGAVSITPLAAPNALLLIGRPESVEKMLGLVKRLDIPFEPTSRFRVFRLKHVPAETAQTQITEFFESEDDSEATLTPRVLAVADFRSNSLIVRASPRDLAEVEAILARLDAGQSDAFNEVRVFKLKNSLAETLGPILQDAVTGQMYGQRSQMGPSGGMAVAQADNYERKSVRLRMVTIGADGRRVLNSGILADAQVTADARTNSLVVTAAADSMPLLEALIRELDQPPSVEAQVKVFTLANGDATNMGEMLESIFGETVAGTELAVRTGIVDDDTSLVGLRFAVDVRTNSIIATGSAGALTVVEAVLARLDANDVRQRRNEVYRLKNSYAPDVATAVNEYLTSKREVETSASGLLSAFEQVEREVIVVSEPVSNSLIVSATPKYFDDIERLVEQLDRRPPMAMIQVVIAEVSLSNYDEFGIEMGLQDSLLFNRVLDTGGLSIPGALFSDGSLTGGQAATNFSTGQVNSDLTFGGLVLSASSESVSVLIRALAQCQKVRVLSRPQIMTLDNQSAQVVVGEDVPYITGTTFSEYGQQNSIDYREVGLILTVTPRISPDGLVVMEIVATNSKVGSTEDGIPVSVAGDQVIRSPRIEMISAQTVVSALDGQTVVLGGLIVDDDEHVTRRVPYLSDIPIAGNLFKYKSDTKARKELLIIMTPRIVEGVEQARQIAEVESARMSWCLQDVECLHGGYSPNPVLYGDVQEGPRVIYPHLTPTIDSMEEPPLAPEGVEMVPTPPGTPVTPFPQTSDTMPQIQPNTSAAPGLRFQESPFQPEDRFLKQ